MSSPGMAIIFFKFVNYMFTFIYACKSKILALVRMESNAFRLKTFFFIDKVTASNGKLIFGVNFT